MALIPSWISLPREGGRFETDMIRLHSKCKMEPILLFVAYVTPFVQSGRLDRRLPLAQTSPPLQLVLWDRGQGSGVRGWAGRLAEVSAAAFASKHAFDGRAGRCRCGHAGEGECGERPRWMVAGRLIYPLTSRFLLRPGSLGCGLERQERVVRSHPRSGV